MAIYQGDKKISGNAKVSSLPLFTTQWQDHITNDASWVRSETFSWQSGAIYVSAYNHLADDLIINVETLYCWNRPDKEVYTTKENPSIGDNVYIINNGTVEFASTIDNISGDTIYPSGMQAYTRYPSGDINNQEVPVTAETETIAGTTITFYRATDGHKIVLPDQESNVSAIYTATGVAWYYVLDTANTRFKLPRSKYAFVGLRDNVGNYVAESLPNITGKWTGTFIEGYNPVTQGSGAFSNMVHTANGSYFGGSYINSPNWNISSNGGEEYTQIDFDASLSSSTYQDDAPVQQRATQMYLYFYVGNTVQDQTTIDVGEITEELNDKADADLANLSNGLANTICTTTPTTVSTATSARPAVVVENYVNGTSWYRVYSDGWCEQGGVVTGEYLQVYFLKPYANANYNIQVTLNSSTEVAAAYAAVGARGAVTSTYFELWGGSTVGYKFWRTCGYISLS